MSRLMKAVTFSYDDGVESDRKLIEIFNRYNMKCTFNINSGLMDNPNMWKYKDKFEVCRMNWKDNLKELYKGHEIAVHGTWHKRPSELSESELKEEFLDDKNELERYFGCEVSGMAYACGDYNDAAVDYLKSIGIKYGRTTKSNYSFELQSDLLRFKPTCHHTDEKLMELCEKFIKSEADKPQIFYVWGHAYEFDADENFYVIENLCKELAGRDDIYFGTNEEVFRYFNLI